MNAPTRPVLRWHGGKWRLAPWIISHFPPHRIYVEPFGGAASVLLRKQRAYAEVYNDLDDEVVNLFRVLRNPDLATRLVHDLHLTPFSHLDFEEAYCPPLDDEWVERARRLCIRSFMGFGSNGHQRKTGFRSNSSRSGTTPAHDWRNYPSALEEIVDRLRGVVIECKPADKVMSEHDSAAALHYVDPPYVSESRNIGDDYAFEMSADEHAKLLTFLKTLAGMVILSGYPSPLYDEALAGWKHVTTEAMADGARPRTEVLWINPAAAAALERQAGAGTLFERIET